MGKGVKVSVVGTIYNQCTEAERTLWSYLNQDFDEPYEILVMDDGSEDDSDDMVLKLQKEYPGMIRYFYFDRPEPTTFCMPENVGIKEARADIVVTTHGYDRIPLNNALEELYYPHLERDDIFVTLRLGFIGPRGSRTNLVGKEVRKLLNSIGWPNNTDDLYKIDRQATHRPIGTYERSESPTLSVRKEWLETIGGYAEEYKHQKNWSCYDIWESLIAFGLKPRNAAGACFHQPHPFYGDTKTVQKLGRVCTDKNIEDWGNLEYKFERAI